METNQQQPEQQNQNSPQMTQEEVLAEILENTRSTKRYLKWQLYITIILIVVPLLAMIALIPMVLNSIGSAYGGLIQ